MRYGKFATIIYVLASVVGKVTRMRFSSLLSSAMSSSQGKLLAAKRNTRSVRDLIRPSSWIKSSVFMRLDASCSPSALRELRIESISSMKIVVGWWYRAKSKRTLISFSESPRHLLTIVDALMLKNVVRHSVATALASIVLPVPGGPNSKMPFHGSRIPWKKCGYFIGIKTASLSRRFASGRPTMSEKRTFGFALMISF